MIIRNCPSFLKNLSELEDLYKEMQCSEKRSKNVVHLKKKIDANLSNTKNDTEGLLKRVE